MWLRSKAEEKKKVNHFFEKKKKHTFLSNIVQKEKYALAKKKNNLCYNFVLSTRQIKYKFLGPTTNQHSSTFMNVQNDSLEDGSRDEDIKTKKCH